MQSLLQWGWLFNIAFASRAYCKNIPLSQLAKPFELSVFKASSSGKALASTLGLTRKTDHVQLGFVFMKELPVHGQLHFRKIQAGKNPAAMLTTHLPASTFHKLLPKLGVRTTAADSRDSLPMLNIEMRASSRREQSSFFIGMMTEQPATAQLVAASVASRVTPSSSFQQHSQEEVLTLKSSQRTFSFRSFCWYLFLMVALLCADLYATDSFVNLQICSLLSSDCLIQLCFDTVLVFKQWALRTALWTTMSSLPFRRSTSTILPRLELSMIPAYLSSSTALCLYPWKIRLLLILASAYSGPSFTVKASFAQTSSFSSFPGISVSFHIFEEQQMATYFTHDELIPLLFANEANILPPALLQHVMEGMLFNDELEEVSDKLNEHWVKEHLPKLPKRDELQFWMVIGETAMESFEKSDLQ